MDPLIGISNDGKAWLINAILNEDTFETQTKRNATGLTYQDRVCDNHISPSIDLKHQQAIDLSDISTTPHSHGAATTNTPSQISAPGDSRDHINLGQEIENDESVEHDDDVARGSNATSLGDWINELRGFASFNGGKNESESMALDGDSTNNDPALSTASDNDKSTGASMRRFTLGAEDLTTSPEAKSEWSFSEASSMEDDDSETMEDFKQRLIYWIAQMMFVSGETAEPSPETTWMIEEIVREQVLEMLQQATILANRRGSRSISIVDLIFQIRHDRAKVSRLKTFLSWKDVRKNVKDSDDKGGGDAGDVGDFEEASGGVNPSAPQKATGTKKAKLVLPWEVQSFYAEQVPERDDEEDEEEEEQNEATLARLASADERTKDMTREEYVYWSDCRQASFTFRKGKRFREWAGFGTIIDSKPNDDVVDILGFLTFEIVQTLTEEALKVKAAEDLANKKASGGGAGATGRSDLEASKKRKREGCSLFEMPEEGRTPVEPKHVREGFRRLQVTPPKYKFMRPGYAGMRTPLRLI
ncbi:transcription initiation protein SPT3 [Exophiala aquamarina CBS 119918]|uniref:Transcription initiation protein SPT3 n=1 Tax=Exophiala aquamarina CBS 119918 TaxID=1182545 RepID=A0A072PXS1_9EURO|nr:transcription initiation protein SPT3 [Exophiala aquamarina CBS 119918]KEF60395.1 transcription initiation protein SPT3 [Exophiala aquamarina CBS 119918]